MNSRLLKEISEIKKQISLLEDYVRVDETGFSFITTDDDATKTDKISRALLQDINTAAKRAGVKAVITTASSGHSEKTISGTRSRHPDNNAVDISNINGEAAQGASSNNPGNPKFKKLGDALVNELVDMGYSLNVESGKDKAVLWQTNTGGNHYNHIHISIKDNYGNDTSPWFPWLDKPVFKTADAARAAALRFKPPPKKKEKK